MFKNLTKYLANKMDQGEDFVPVKSILNNEHFRPLYLLTKKRKPERIFHPAPYYRYTRLTLGDVLLPGEHGKNTESLLQDSSPFTVTKASTDQAEGEFSISFDPASTGVEGGATLSKVFSIKVHKKGIPQDSLETLIRKRQINMDHSFIQQLQRTDINLYVVTEILEASEEAIYKESTKAGGGIRAKIYATFCAKVSRENNESIGIPKGCTLAFSTIPLHIRDGAWGLKYFDIQYCLGSHGLSQGKLGVVVEEVKNRCQIFSKLSPDLLLITLNTLKAVMRDNNLLQELSQKMERVSEENEGYELKTESPDLKALFSTLERSPRDRLLLLAEGITYVLDALHELMEDQLLLLLESLERKIVPRQLKLVADLLKHDLEKQKEPFRVDPGLLSFPQKEQQGLTMALVELSGVKLQENGSAFPRHQPFEAMAALFVALYALNLLSGS